MDKLSHYTKLYHTSLYKDYNLHVEWVNTNGNKWVKYYKKNRLHINKEKYVSHDILIVWYDFKKMNMSKQHTN